MKYIINSGLYIRKIYFSLKLNAQLKIWLCKLNLHEGKIQIKSTEESYIKNIPMFDRFMFQ